MASNASSLGFGATSKWNNPVGFQRKNQGAPKAALTIGEFLKQSCDNMAIGVGPRSHEDCPHRVTTECYSPDDSASLNEVIAAAYRQVFGNAHVMDFERSVELEAQLRDGRLTVREFIKGLAKSSFYKSRFFSSVAPQRGIELNYKHLLGRAPESQAEISTKIALMSEHGHDAVIDSIVDSAEYLEVFGSDIVPYARSWSSPADLSTAAFPMLALAKSLQVATVQEEEAQHSLVVCKWSGSKNQCSKPSCWSHSKQNLAKEVDSKQPGITQGKIVHRCAVIHMNL